jgi:hypothetical protein
VKPVSFPLVEEHHLLPAPADIRQQEEAILQAAPPASSP